MPSSGRNGVGKSTLLLTIMGYTQIGRGRIVWRGEDITARPPHRRALAGIGWVAQEREIFSSLTVEENLTVAARAGRWDLPAVYDLFPRLAERRRNFGNQLSGGEQQMLAIARALMTNPALLLLDEPLEGLAPIVVDELAAAIARMTRKAPCAFILVEQHVEIALPLTQHALVLERGRIAHSGPSAAAPCRPRHARPADRPAAARRGSRGAPCGRPLARPTYLPPRVSMKKNRFPVILAIGLLRPNRRRRSASDALLQSIELAVAAEAVGADGAVLPRASFRPPARGARPSRCWLPPAPRPSALRSARRSSICGMRISCTWRRTQVQPTSSPGGRLQLGISRGSPEQVDTRLCAN